MPFFLVDKPPDWTSFDVVGFIRREERKKIYAQGGQAPSLRVGHAGTLDPFATGLLIVAIGRESTKRLDEFKKLPKTYIATIRLGATSDTDDRTGTITLYSVIPTEAEGRVEGSLRSFRSDSSTSPFHGSAQNDKPSIAQIKKVLKKFIGEQKQIPPRYSAKKINGQKMYSMARAGKDFAREPSVIHIHNIKLLDYSWPDLKIKIDCGAGTYIRSLARDLGEALGVGGYCQELRRTKIGPYELDETRKTAQINDIDKGAPFVLCLTQLN
jgi:tRNA pseudouridine55 synthase